MATLDLITSARHGNVPGFGRYVFGDDGSAWTNRNTRGRACAWRELSGTITPKGYVRLMLKHDDGRSVMKMLHVLILEAFVGPCPIGLECCHADDDKRNNRLGNLRWDTSKANARDRIRNGRCADTKGSRNGRARIDETIVAAIKSRIAAGVPPRFVRTEFGLSVNQFSKIQQGRTWRHV